MFNEQSIRWVIAIKSEAKLIIENFQLDVSAEDVNAMNKEYNRYLNWITEFKKKLKKQPNISQQMIDNISPKAYINAARDYADRKKQQKKD